MSLKKLCAEIEQNSRKDAAKTIKDARKEAKQIITDAEEKASELVESEKKQAKQFSDTEAQSRITATQLEANKILSDARDEAVRQSIDQVWSYYSKLSQRSGYKTQLKAWAKKAIDELEMPGAVIRCREKDRSILRSARFKVGQPLDCAGGLRAESKDGKVIVDYTLEAQFESRREEIARTIHSNLFSSSDLETLKVSAVKTAKNRSSKKPRSTKKAKPVSKKKTRSTKRSVSKKKKSRGRR